jgi:UDP-2,3-diacylglucosamine pyrophosphatase LpxH
MGKREKALDCFQRLLKDDEGKYSVKLPVGGNHKYVFFSDMHLQNGNAREDRFARNKEVLLAALDYYKNNDYSVILLGDIEDFHQHWLYDIYVGYEDLYEKFQEFDDGKIIRVYGNHDVEWSLEDPVSNVRRKTSVEAVRLGDHLLATHGHQAQEFYEGDLQMVRFGTFIGRFAEKIFGCGTETSVTQPPNSKDEIYFDWAEENKKILICGHTHNPVFASQSIVDFIPFKMEQLRQEKERAQGGGDTAKVKALQKRIRWFEGQQKLLAWQNENEKRRNPRKIELDRNSPFYFNTGSCIFKDGITGIEIDGTLICLIYWGNHDNKRDHISHTRDLNDIMGFDVSG